MVSRDLCVCVYVCVCVVGIWDVGVSVCGRHGCACVGQGCIQYINMPVLGESPNVWWQFSLSMKQRKRVFVCERTNHCSDSDSEYYLETD